MNSRVITLKSGAVEGVLEGDVVRYLDIPYAAPPVGENRFREPRAHAPWDGIRDGSRFGANAPQWTAPFPDLDIRPLIGSGWQRGDDFLTANVWAPAAGGADLPVMVFVHGGAFAVGSNGAAVSDGAAFARRGVVLIAINYRLGVEGFLAIPGAPTNLGLRDQIFALGWVRDNARAFGGNPDNVTVFGESAGAMTLANLVTSPLAHGLFRRAIIESGHGSMVRAIPVAERLTRKLASTLGVAANIEGFRSTTVEACVAAAQRVQLPTTRIDLRDESGREPAFGLSRFLPVYGDDVLPEPPLVALARGAGAEIDLLIGSNAEEMNLYFVPTKVKPRIGRLLSWFVLRRCVPRAWAILKAYGAGRKGRSAGAAFTDALSDLVFRLPARRFAAAHAGRTHCYEFGWRSPAFGGELGACHGVELPFVFNTLASCSGPRGLLGEDPPQALADRVQAIWIRYATDGHLPWPEYADDTRQVHALELGVTRTEPRMPAEYF